MLLVSAFIISSISLIFSVVWDCVYVQHNRANVIPRIRRDVVPRGVGDICKRRFTWILSLEKFRIRSVHPRLSRSTSTSQKNAFFKRFGRLIVMTVRSQSSHGFYRVRHFRNPVYTDFFFFSVFGYILSFLDKVIVKSIKSTSTS